MFKDFSIDFNLHPQSLGRRDRVPDGLRVILFFWPMSASSANQISGKGRVPGRSNLMYLQQTNAPVCRLMALECFSLDPLSTTTISMPELGIRRVSRWARRGTRPNASRDQRTVSTYILGAICPKQAKGAALILPSCTTEAVNLHSRKSPRRLHQEPMPSSSSIRPHGICQQDCPFPPTSPLSRCRRNALNSIPLRTSGSTCATTGSRTASSNPTTISSITAATPSLEDHAIGLRQWAHEF